MYNNYRSAWEQETLSPEADARIRQILVASSCSGTYKETILMKNIKRKIPKAAAAVIAAVITLTVAALAVAVVHIDLVTTRFPGYFEVDFQATDDEYIELSSWYPQYIPDGFEESFISDTQGHSQLIKFTNEDHSALLVFSYETAGTGKDISFNLFEGKEPVTVNGTEGLLVNGTHLYWTDHARGIGFSLSIDGENIDLIDSTELIAIAESVMELDEPLIPTNEYKKDMALEQLGDYRPTVLPEGYEASELYASPLEGKDDWYAYVRRWYENNRHDMIYITYETYRFDHAVDDPAAEILDLNTPDSATTSTDMTIQGFPAVLIEDSRRMTLFWADAEKGLVFSVSGDTITGEEAIAIAEGITLS